MKFLALLQARVTSSRLPGKVLLPLLGEPMLFRQIERIRRVARIDQLIVATSVSPSDDVIALACAERDIVCGRGSLDDVLDRFVRCAEPYAPEILIRLTGDCPLADPELLEVMLQEFEQGTFDYLTNADPPTFPDGLDIEIMRFSCLMDAHREATLPSHREHVTPYLRAHPAKFRLGNHRSKVDLSELRWTVDEARDFAFIQSIYENLYPDNPHFSTDDILDLLRRNPHLNLINADIERNQGLRKSLLDDETFLGNRK